MLPQDNFFFNKANFSLFFFTKFHVILAILTFTSGIAQSQEYGFVRERVRNFGVEREYEEGFFLLHDFSAHGEYIKVIRNLDDQNAIVKFGKSPNPDLISQLEIYALNNEWKTSEAISNFKTGDHIIIQVLNSNLFKLERDWKIVYENGNFLKLELTDEGIEPLLQSKSVIYIAKSLKARVETPVVGHDLSVNQISFAKKQYPELDAENLNVSIKENLFDPNDIDLKNRTVLDEESSENIEQHATAIATLSIGGGNSGKEGEGVATGAIAFSASFLDLLPDPNNYFVDNEIYVQNHSYGTQVASEYGAEAAAYDQNVLDLPQLVHVFSSGNSGTEASANGTYSGIEGYANLTGNFKMAKNVLVVGATDETYSVLDRSSKGPAQDGRIKPELVAYATQGTSDAAALVSGSALMLQDLYLTKTGEYPKASLVKAALIAGATDVGRKGPDFDSGYGSLDLEKSMDIVNQDQYFLGSLEGAETVEFSVEIPENAKELKVVLSWIDPPANAGSASALINDLDLKIINADNITMLPWVLNSSPDINSLREDAKRGVDHLNNNEMIGVEYPKAGSYTIHVSANLTEGMEQAFAIAYDITPSNLFEWTFPTQNNGFISGSRKIARWNNSFDQANAELQINLNGAGWESINTNFSVNNGYAELELGEDYSGGAQLKMLIGGKEFLSDKFVIAPKISADVLYDCEEEYLISWPEISNADGFRVFNLGDTYLEEFATTETNLLNIKKSDLSSNYISVVPVFEGVEGEKGLTIDLSTQGAGCYFDTFYAFIVDDLKVNSTLILGTSINVSKVEFFRRNGQETSLLNSMLPPFDMLQINAIDEDLAEGDVYYFAVITLNDGTSIQTNEVNFFIPGDRIFTVYPNPLENGEEITIVSKGDDLDFYMFDMVGQRILQDKLIQFQDRLEFPRLARGVYLLVAERDGKRIGTKKIIIK